jgi:uncharacterized protein
MATTENLEPPGMVDRHAIDYWLHQVSHLLPSQGPIKVFVHHNTLHAFEHTTFDQGVLEGLSVYGSQPYFSEDRFRKEMSTGRILASDLEQALQDDLSDESDRLVAHFGTRFELRLAMLKFPLRSLPPRELTWFIAEGGALTDFFRETDPQVVRTMTESTRKEILHLAGAAESEPRSNERMILRLINGANVGQMESWSERKWRTKTLEYLWEACKDGVERALRGTSNNEATTHNATAIQNPQRSMDGLVNEFLIPFCASFLDQGFAAWPMPYRDQGIFKAFCELYRSRYAPLPAWLTQLPDEITRVDSCTMDAYDVVQDELQRLELSVDQCEERIARSLMPLRGWGGMIWQMETQAPWTPKPAPSGSLLGYLAIRMLLERLASNHMNSISKLSNRWDPSDKNASERKSIESRAFTVFQIAQFRQWTPKSLAAMDTVEWKRLLQEIDAFHSLERRRVFQSAYEHHYRVRALDAISIHSAERLHKDSTSKTPKFQVITCIDEREESFRRHLEEVEPLCETFGAAGFFAVIMYYRGAAEAHFRPLCPINIVPKHFVVEEPVFSAESESDKRSQRRKWIGHVSHRVHSGSRTILGGLITGLFGTLATFPLVARVLAPHITARIRSSIGGLVRPPATELHLERASSQPGPDADSLGFSVEEMASIVVRILEDIGLVKNFSPVILFLGHGSSSLNNPHESAYNCGACSGGRGGPNARAFASMANDARVRELVAKAGILIPDSVRFIGGYHNTCNDRVEYFDLDKLAWQLRPQFREMQAKIDEARARNAQERVRRFESARFGLTPAEALRHVEERSEDLSQARPEYNHATNAMCFVGQRSWSRGLFLDRRAFLASYDPTIDDENGKIVERILQAAIPVCGGISLEYYFSTVDPEGYGCGSKLPHNITALAGVMTGAASDLRPGLSAQMVEIHEPMRILFVVQTQPHIMHRIIQANASIRTLMEGAWVQLALLDAATSQIMLYKNGEFTPYQVTDSDLPQFACSHDLYRAERDHLPFASIAELPKSRKERRDQS